MPVEHEPSSLLREIDNWIARRYGYVEAREIIVGTTAARQKMKIIEIRGPPEIRC